MYVCLYVCKETYIKKVTKQKQTKITIMPMIKVDSKQMKGFKKGRMIKTRSKLENTFNKEKKSVR